MEGIRHINMFAWMRCRDFVQIDTMVKYLGCTGQKLRRRFLVGVPSSKIPTEPNLEIMAEGIFARFSPLIPIVQRLY